MKKINLKKLWENLKKSCVIVENFNDVEFVLKRWSEDDLITIKVYGEPTKYRALNDFESFKDLLSALITKTKQWNR